MSHLTVIIGASRGIGLALAAAYLQHEAGSVLAVARQTDRPALQALAAAYPDRLLTRSVDVTQPTGVAALAQQLRDQALPVARVVHCAGLLHHPSYPNLPEKKLEDLAWESMAQVFAVNTLAPAMVLRHLLPCLRQDAPAVMAMLSARVGSISDNHLGGWYSYRASKAALNQLLRTAAIEAKRRYPNVVVTALHPGTTDTELSAPFQKNVPAEKLFTPDFVAERLMAVIADLSAEDSGGFKAWDGQEIPW